MDTKITDVDAVMDKVAGNKQGRVYLGTEFEGDPVTIAVSRREVEDSPWDDLETLLTTAEPDEIPDAVVDEMIALLGRLDLDGGDVDQDWRGLATSLTATPADEIPDEVLSAMRAKVTQADMVPSDD